MTMETCIQSFASWLKNAECNRFMASGQLYLITQRLIAANGLSNTRHVVYSDHVIIRLMQGREWHQQ